MSDSREEFEAWAKDVGWSLERGAHGEYVYGNLDAMQGAWNHQQSKIDAKDAELRELREFVSELHVRGLNLHWCHNDHYVCTALESPCTGVAMTAIDAVKAYLRAWDEYDRSLERP